ELLPLIYAEVHDLAQLRMANWKPGQTLRPTALVHEAYLRASEKSDVTWQGRQHFFFAAARAMRDILVEQARGKAGPRRGGGRQREPLDEGCAVLEPPAEDVLALHEALEELVVCEIVPRPGNEVLVVDAVVGHRGSEGGEVGVGEADLAAEQ